jgi:hypothetical protein
VAYIPSKVGFNLNKKLTALVNQWQAAGSPEQEGFDWTKLRKNWLEAFPDQARHINSLPSQIDRSHVRSTFISSKQTIIEKFLTVMIWGYGDRGYGPYRVNQMLQQPHAIPVLTEVFELAQKGLPKQAYEYLSKHKIKTLGPSYSSKFISFCTPREIGAPIYDSYVALWVQSFAAAEFSQVNTSSNRWNLNTYSRYWDWIHEHSTALGCYPDEVELVLFRDAESKFSKSSSWSGK